MDALIDENPNLELEQVREKTKQVQAKLLKGWIEEELLLGTKEMMKKRATTAAEKQGTQNIIGYRREHAVP